MEQNIKSSITSYIEEISTFRQIEPNEIPNIDLYMDQVTTFFDDHLAHYKRDENDKILTKTMINNYIKDGVLPSPEKKKYTKEHMMLFAFTYIMKQTLAVNDIKTMLSPIINEKKEVVDEIDIQLLYSKFLEMQKVSYERLAQEMIAGYELLMNDIEDEEGVAQFATLGFVAMLASNAGALKYVAEKIIDECLTVKRADEKQKVPKEENIE